LIIGEGNVILMSPSRLIIPIPYPTLFLEAAAIKKSEDNVNVNYSSKLAGVKQMAGSTQWQALNFC